MECTHRAIRSWSQLDGSPVQMWSCVDCGWKFEPVREREPLTTLEIDALINGVDSLGIGRHVMHKVARAIERAHGIGEKK